MIIEKLNHEDILKIVNYALNKNTRDNGIVYNVNTEWGERVVYVFVRNVNTGYEKIVFVDNKIDYMERMKKDIAIARKIVLTNKGK